MTPDHKQRLKRINTILKVASPNFSVVEATNEKRRRKVLDDLYFAIFGEKWDGKKGTVFSNAAEPEQIEKSHKGLMSAVGRMMDGKVARS